MTTNLAGDGRVIRGSMAAAFSDPSFARSHNPAFLRLEKQLTADPRTGRAVIRLQEHGIDKSWLIAQLLNLVQAYREGRVSRTGRRRGDTKKRPRAKSTPIIFKSEKRKRYEKAISALASQLPLSRERLETYVVPLLDAKDTSAEAKEVRSLLKRDTMESLIASLRELGPVFETLRDRRPRPRFVKTHRHLVNTLFGVNELEVIKTAAPLPELHSKLIAFINSCEARYSGQQLKGNLSPVLNTAFEMFDIAVDYPRSAKALGEFLRRKATVTPV